MRPDPRCSMLGVLAAVLTVSCSPENLKPFTSSGEPDAAAGVPGVVKGRIWVTPNPIHVPLPPDGATPGCARIELDNIGVDAQGGFGNPNVAVVIESLTVEGAPAIDFYPHALEQTFPQSFTGGFAGSICAFPGYDLPAGGTVVIRTSDPTSPTVRVPVIVDPDLDPTAIPPYDRASTILVVEPNPIELPTTAGSLVVKMRPYLPLGGEIPITAVEITEVTVTGAGLSLTGMTCVSGDSLPCRVCSDSFESCQSAASITLVRDPLVTPSEGELRVASTDLAGHDYTLIVPILAP